MIRSAGGTIRRTPAMLIAVAVAMTGIAAVAPAQTDGPAQTTAVVAAAPLTLPVPPGFCAVGRDDRFAIESFGVLDAALGSDCRLLAWFVDCDTLAAVRAGMLPAGRMFDRYGVYVTPVDAAGAAETFAGWDRAAFVREIARTLPPFDRSRLSLAAVGDAPPDIAGATVQLVLRDAGLLGSDANAYYLANAAELAYGQERRILAGVAGATLVHGVVLSVILYDGFEDAGTLAMLEQAARAAMRALIDANPGGEGAGRAFAIDANHLLLIGFAVGLLFIAAGIVNGAWKWWCRRHGLGP